MSFTTVLWTLAVASVAAPVSAQISSNYASLTSLKIATTAGTESVKPTGACGGVSLASSSFFSATPTASTFHVPADVAHECLQSVPIVKDDATTILEGLEAWWEFQSTLSWLKNPPSTYPFPGVDLMGGLESIRHGVENGTIDGEYKFQSAIQDLIFRAADAHFQYPMDLLRVFSFVREQAGPVVAISDDGHSLPLTFYMLHDLDQNGSSSTWSASPITSMDGQSSVDYFTKFLPYLGYPDYDAAWNQLFYEIASHTAAGGNDGSFVEGIGGGFYLGPNVTIAYANGTVRSFNSSAFSSKDFTSVDSGEAFYDAFCSPTASATTMLVSATSTSSSTPAVTARSRYPESPYMDHEGTVAGYFLDEPHADTAVLSITSFTTNNTGTTEAQHVVQEFLQACRDQSKKKLIIDLFPSLEPFNAENARAHPAFDVLGELISAKTSEFRSNLPIDPHEFIEVGGYSPWDAGYYHSLTNSTPLTWPELYGPQTYHGDNYTTTFSQDYTDANSSRSTTGITITGYGDRSNFSSLSQPFASEDILLLSDGACNSTCTVFFSHFLKWQGKVKSVAIGGRPQRGPMQFAAGVRGSQVLAFPVLYAYMAVAFAGLDPEEIETYLTTIAPVIGVLNATADYLIARTADPDSQAAVSVNIWNNIAQGDPDLTPLQFTYEAADCRLFWTKEMVLDITAAWKMGADVYWKSNFSMGCVEGSTVQASSLSGNSTLFGGGVQRNVSVDETGGTGKGVSSAESGGGRGRGGGASASASASASARSGGGSSSGNTGQGSGSRLAEVEMNVLGMGVAATIVLMNWT